MEVLIGFSGIDPKFSKFKEKYDALGALVLDNFDGMSTILISDDYDIDKLSKDIGFYGILEVRRKSVRN